MGGFAAFPKTEKPWQSAIVIHCSCVIEEWANCKHDCCSAFGKMRQLACRWWTQQEMGCWCRVDRWRVEMGHIFQCLGHKLLKGKELRFAFDIHEDSRGLRMLFHWMLLGRVDRVCGCSGPGRQSRHWLACHCAALKCMVAATFG